MLWIFVFIFVVNVALGEDHAESRVVNLKQGPVRGYKSTEGDFYVFYGVPYATAPTGSQRFQAPLPPPVWTDTLEAVDRKVVCPQHNYHGFVFNQNTEVKEDCLIANVYVPKTEQKNLPVLVYVHGGGYVIGHGNFVTPKNLVMTKRAIVVNFNYRLGAHGFLCLGTKDIPGNVGMKDQVALLKWVQDNIASFGGDPDDVTIAGYSAGSSAVDLLHISKMANGLFNRVIPESGANLAAFSVQTNPLETAKKYAKQLNFTNVDDINALEEFYKTVSYEVLNSLNVMDRRDGTFTFSPCVERDTGDEPFLDDSPANILKSGNYQKRPMLYGFAKMEGLFRLPMFKEWIEDMNNKFSDYLPADLQFDNEEDKEAVAAKIKKFYFGVTPTKLDNILGFIDFHTDIVFAYPTLWSVKLQVEAGNKEIYLYEYAFVSEYSTMIPYTKNRGANHCDQTIAIHDGVNITHFGETNISEDFKNMKRTLREIWLNFVTTGKPVPDGSALPAWPPTSADGSPYMVLDKVLKLTESPMLEKRKMFWEEIYNKYYRPPVPPGELLTQKHVEL